MARKPSRPVSKPFSASTDVPVAKPRTKKKNLDGANAYTFIPTLPKRHRTSAQTLSLTRDEEELNRPRRRGKDDEGDSDEDMQARIRKVAMMIAQDDKGDVASEESDIDSDEAWEEDGSDEERWGDVFRDLQKGKKAKGKAKAEERVIKPKKPLTVNLDESEDEDVPRQSAANGKAKAVEPISEDEEEDDEDLAEEDDDQESDGSGDGDESDDLALDGGDEEEVVDEDDEDDDEDDDDDDDDDEDESDDDDDLDLPSDLSDDEADPDTLDGLDAFVDKLAESDKKRKSAKDSAEQPKKRRVLPVVAAPALGEGNDLGLKSNQKVDLASLIASHPSLSSASALIPKSKPKSTATNVLNGGVLAAPLPTVVQDRLNREAAYEKTKEEGAKWATMMKRVKEAEHLSFPLQGSDRGGVKSNGEMLSSFKPANEHESAIQSLLAKANLTESGVKAAEDEALQGKDLSAEEIAERRAALRQQRELMFREEARQKRVAKIKSKTFRKLARKRAAKAGEAALEDMDEEDALALQEKMERQRARERATLKHGAKTGRWAREAEHAHGMGDEYRSARGEMLDIQERLKRRIAGKGDGSDEDDSESDDDAQGQDEESIRRRAFDQLDALDGAHEDAGDKGLLGMKFMKKAEERRRQAAREEEAEMRRDIEMFGEEGASGDEDEEEDKDKSAMLTLGASGGRMVFSGPVAGKGSSAIEPAKANGASAASTQAAQPSRPTQSRRDVSPLPSTEENPWLAASSTAGPSRKRNTVLNANSSAVEKTTAALKKAKSAHDPSAVVDDEAVEIETDGNKLLQQRKRKEAVASDDEDEDELLPRKRVGFKQRDLVSEAFAGDNVVQDFAQEKQRAIEEDAPKVEDTSLPGWGSWSGKGAKKRKANPKFLKTTPGLLATDRKDAKFANVIISEKKDKKASQFQVKDLPYPYTSVEQYEARFKNPLGSEWNSRGVHQRETMPRVTKKKGAIIEPIRRLF